VETAKLNVSYSVQQSNAWFTLKALDEEQEKEEKKGKRKVEINGRRK
jgi:hypothetical protein